MPCLYEQDATKKRILITGMSGTGKSTLVNKLASCGYRAVDLDAPEWSEWVEVDGNPTGAKRGHDWRWREDRVQRLLETEKSEILFISGCAENMVKFYPRFDKIILLSAPVPVIVERLTNRTNNTYGRRTEELDRVLEHIRTIEPKLRRRAGHEIDTSAPLEVVVEQVLTVANLVP
ncbi:MAG TPA: AAA family ATPase [Acidobacteriota bacterium]|nr:AAA family ATPase [Acidobacteriota bacterium]